jgi:hypothetical protein
MGQISRLFYGLVRDHHHYCEDCFGWWSHDDDLCEDVQDKTCPMHVDAAKHTGDEDELSDQVVR